LLIAVLLAPVAVAAIILVINLQAWYHFRSARECLEKYHDTEAREHLQACLDTWPRDADALLLAARAARRLGKYPEAEGFLNRYQGIRGPDEDLTLEGALLRAERGEVDAVRDYCRLLVKQKHADTPLILEAQARGYLRQFRLADAMDCLQEWLKRQPNNAQALYLKGNLLEENMNRREAIASYRRALQVDPEHDWARTKLAVSLLDLAQAPEALPHLKYLLRRQPHRPLLRVYLARCYVQLGRVEKAEKVLDEVLAARPHLAEALAERGSLALQRGQSRAAETWLRQAAALEPTNFQVNYRLSQALLKNGKSAEARKLQKRVKQIENDMDRIHRIVTRDMQRRPHDPALHYEVGVIAMRAGSIAEGLRWLHSALREDPNYGPAHQLLGMYYQQTGSPARAAQHLKRAQAASARPSPVP
jgi:pentatricopeptide repeat protein